MNSRKMRNVNNEYVDVEVIRYFLNNENEYLIYSLNELDESGYTKLYAAKIIGSLARIITDNDEWLLIKDIIKEVVKNNRDGSPLPIMDLNEDDLSDVILQDNRVFKLQGNLVNLLSENKRVQKPVVIEEEFGEPEITDIEEGFETDYEELYHNEVSKNEQLLEKNNRLEEQLVKYQNIIIQMKELLQD